MTQISFTTASLTQNKVPNLATAEELLVWAATLYATVNNATQLQLAPNTAPISLATVADTKAANNRSYVGILAYVPLAWNYHVLPLPTWKKVVEQSSAIGSTDFDQDY